MCADEHQRNVKQHLCAKDIDAISTHFPLCFAHVHQRLSSHHRLGHHARWAEISFFGALKFAKN